MIITIGRQCGCGADEIGKTYERSGLRRLQKSIICPCKRPESLWRRRMKDEAGVINIIQERNGGMHVIMICAWMYLYLGYRVLWM